MPANVMTLTGVLPCANQQAFDLACAQLDDYITRGAQPALYDVVKNSATLTVSFKSDSPLDLSPPQE